MRIADWGLPAGGEDGGEVGFWDGGGEFWGYVAFVLECLGKGADAEAGFEGVTKDNMKVVALMA